jgi:hypothetical protein
MLSSSSISRPLAQPPRAVAAAGAAALGQRPRPSKLPRPLASLSSLLSPRGRLPAPLPLINRYSSSWRLGGSGHSGGWGGAAAAPVQLRAGAAAFSTEPPGGL